MRLVWDSEESILLVLTKGDVVPAAISKDVRERAVAAWERGEGSQQQVAVMFGVTVACLGRWVRAKKARGSVAPIA